jgi:hypothetical protein
MPFHDIDENTGTYKSLSTMLMKKKRKLPRHEGAGGLWLGDVG